MAMQTIRLNREAREVIRSHSRGAGFLETARNISPDGSADVPVSEDVFERLEAHRHAGESYSDLTIRLFATLGKALN